MICTYFLYSVAFSFCWLFSLLCRSFLHWGSPTFSFLLLLSLVLERKFFLTQFRIFLIEDIIWQFWIYGDNILCYMNSWHLNTLLHDVLMNFVSPLTELCFSWRLETKPYFLNYLVNLVAVSYLIKSSFW